MKQQPQNPTPVSRAEISSAAPPRSSPGNNGGAAGIQQAANAIIPVAGGGTVSRGAICERDTATGGTRGEMLLANVRHVALDMDGTLYRGGFLFQDTVPFLSLLDDLGVGRTFLTNNSSKSVEDYVTHFRRLGIEAAPEDFFTSTRASIEYLRAHASDVKRIYVLGTKSMRDEIASAGFAVVSEDPADEPDAVLVGFDTTLTFARLCRAAYWVKNGKLFVASHPDRVCPTDEPNVLVDCGSICAALKEATGRSPDAVAGKPDARMLKGLLRQNGLRAENLAVIGDRFYTDIEMARRTGAISVLVLTGETTLEEARSAEHPPDVIVPNLAALGTKLREAKAPQNSA